MRARSLTLSALGGLSILSLAVVSSVMSARAQTPPADNVSKLEFQNADVRAALRDLFKISGRSYTIDPAVQGAVTLRLQNVPFDTALQNLTRGVDATYRIEGDRYAIVSSTQAAGPGQGGGFGGLGGGGNGRP